MTLFNLFNTYTYINLFNQELLFDSYKYLAGYLQGDTCWILAREHNIYRHLLRYVILLDNINIKEVTDSFFHTSMYFFDSHKMLPQGLNQKMYNVILRMHVSNPSR